MKVLIAGGAGFIGHNLESMLDEDITVVDNFITGRNIPKSNYKRCDIKDYIEKVSKYDEIYYLCALASPKHYMKYPLETIKASIQILNVLENTKAKVLFTSTSEIYGDPLVNPQKEDYWGNVNSFGKRSCYDEGKRCAEAILYNFDNVRIPRIFNTYGPYMSKEDGRVISNFIIKALLGENLEIYGDGTQTRSFCFVTDTCRALIDLMKSDYNRPINIGNPNEITINELANLIIKMTKSKSKIIYKDKMPDDPSHRRPDISLAKEKINWKPEVSLEEGLEKTILYFKEVI